MRGTLTAADLLALEPLGEDRFRAMHNLDNGRAAIFGGQPLVQGLAAASRTVDGWPAHTMSGQFLRAGATGKPLDFHVEAVRDGRRYAARRVVAWQDGKPIFDMLCSFHKEEEGPSHETAVMPEVPPPESLISVRAFMAANAERLPQLMVETHGRPFPIELRVLDPESVFFEHAKITERSYWFRIPSAIGIEAPQEQQALLAFLSDFYFAGTAGAMHFTPGDSMKLAVVTLNHSLWFHAPVNAGEWLLFHTDSPWAGHGRGLVRGMIFDRAGRLAANVVQEISMRTL